MCGSRARFHRRQVFPCQCPFSFRRALSRDQVASQEQPIDETKLTYADGTTITLDLNGLKVTDVIELVDIENARIAAAEMERGRPF